MRATTFNRIAQEFSTDIAIRVVQYGVILKTTKMKKIDITTTGSFGQRCKKRFEKYIAWSDDNVDRIVDIFMASAEFEQAEDLCGLGCLEPTSISQFIKSDDAK